MGVGSGRLSAIYGLQVRPLIQLRLRFESGIPTNNNNVSEFPLQII
jgi:hypothetical protein